MALAIQMENLYSKEEILNAYLNSLYFGHGIYGLSNASSFYFGKDVNHLSISEIALLVGLIKGPNIYSPIINMENSLNRRNIILSILLKNGIITDYDYDLAINENISILGKSEINRSLFINYTLNELLNIDVNYDEIEVYTSFNQEISHHLYSLLNDEKTANIVLIEPKTGYIKALFSEDEYGVYSKDQIGSTIKPFLYYLALENGFTPTTSFISEPTTFYIKNESYSPMNYQGRYAHLPISMAYALATSDNIYAVKTHLFLGMDKLQDLLSTLNIMHAKKIPSLALGTVEASLLEITNAYNILASNGLKTIPKTIRFIKHKETVVYEAKESSQKLLNEESVFIINDLLTMVFDKNIEHATGYSISKYLTKVWAAKTGTTEKKTYMIGFNPYITLGVSSSSINTSSKEIWAKAIEFYSKDLPNVWYKKPKNVEEILVNPSSLNPKYYRRIFFKKKYPSID